MKKILVCGSRDWNNEEPIRRELKKYLGEKITVIHGAARGADTLAGLIAQDLGYEVIAVPAEWNKYGKSAGYRRNLQMIEMNPDEVLAFSENIKESKGTAITCTLALNKGIPCHVFSK